MEAGTDRSLTVRLEREIAAPPERVWQVISSEAGMRDWLGPKTFEPRPGGRVLFDVQHGATRWIMFGVIQTFEPAGTLSFTWQEIDTGRLTIWPAPTLLTITLTARGAATLVVLEHSGFEALPDGIEQHKGYAEGWASLNDLETLARLCEAAPSHLDAAGTRPQEGA